MRDERELVEMELLAQRFEIVDVMIDGEERHVVRQRRASAAALVVLDDAMMLLEGNEIARERLVIHAGSAVNDDDRRPFAAFAIPETDVVAGVDEVIGSGGEDEREQQNHRALLR